MPKTYIPEPPSVAEARAQIANEYLLSQMRKFHTIMGVALRGLPDGAQPTMSSTGISQAYENLSKALDDFQGL